MPDCEQEVREPSINPPVSIDEPGTVECQRAVHDTDVARKVRALVVKGRDGNSGFGKHQPDLVSKRPEDRTHVTDVLVTF